MRCRRQLCTNRRAAEPESQSRDHPYQLAARGSAWPAAQRASTRALRFESNRVKITYRPRTGNQVASACGPIHGRRRSRCTGIAWMHARMRRRSADSRLPRRLERLTQPPSVCFAQALQDSCLVWSGLGQRHGREQPNWPLVSWVIERGDGLRGQQRGVAGGGRRCSCD